MNTDSFRAVFDALVDIACNDTPHIPPVSAIERVEAARLAYEIWSNPISHHQLALYVTKQTED